MKNVKLEKTILANEESYKENEKLRESLSGMLESYDILMRIIQERFPDNKNVLEGVVKGSFKGEIDRARKLVSDKPEEA